jgi:hypothetical protein
MKRISGFVYGCCLLALPVFVTAQAPAGTMSNTMAMKEAAKEVKVTGCVAQSADKKTFTLTGAMMADEMAMKAQGGMAMKPDMKGMTYALAGGTLTPHLGHTVEITGTVTDMKAAPASMNMNSMNRDEMAHQTLNVKSLRMIAASCKQ